MAIDSDLKPIIKQLLEHTHVRKFARGQVIQYQGEPVSKINIVVSGCVCAHAITRSGNSVWLNDFMANDVFGFEAWLGNMTSRYEIIVKRDVEVLSINKAMLADMSKTHSELLRYIIRKLAEQFSTQTQRLIEADSLSISGRICAELKRQSKTLDLNSNSAIIQPIPVFSDFALKVGSSRESVSRTINELCKSGVIIRKPGALIIASEDDLLARIR